MAETVVFEECSVVDCLIARNAQIPIHAHIIGMSHNDRR